MGTNASMFTVTEREIARTSDGHAVLATGLSNMSISVERFSILVIGLIDVSGREGGRDVGSGGDRRSIRERVVLQCDPWETNCREGGNNGKVGTMK